MIDSAFGKMDKTGDGVITVDDLKLAYNVSQHPKYLSGEKTADELLKKFMDVFQPGDTDDKVAIAAFSSKSKVNYTNIAVRSLPCHTATGTHVPYRITQCYLPPDRGDTPALTPAEAGTRLSYHGIGCVAFRLRYMLNVKGVDGGCAKHLTIVFYTVVMLLTFILIIIISSIP